MRVSNFIFLFIFFLSSCALWTPQHSSVSEVKPINISRFPAARSLGCKELFAEIVKSNFNTSKKNFDKQLRSFGYSASDAKTVKENLDALFFIDYRDQQDLLLKMAGGEVNIEDADIFKLYNSSYSSNSPFDNYVNASKYLTQSKPEINSNTLKNVHKKMMEGGIDGIDPRKIGNFRDEFIIGNIPSSEPVSKASYDEMVRNPYISVDRIEKLSSGEYYGEIGYPNASNSTPEVDKIIKKKNPELYQKIVDFKNSGAGWNTPEFKVLTADMINELTEDLMAWFVRERDQIGSINSVADLKKFSKLVANFQRSLISIHPFADGNGRSVRQLALYYPFQKSGLPVPRLSDPDADLYTPIDDWVDQIYEGLFNGLHLYDEMTKRMKSGLAIESTPELIFPNIPNKVYRFEKHGYSPIGKNGKKKVVDAQKTEYMEYAYLRIQGDEELARRYSSEPYSVLDEIREDYMKFSKNSQIDFFHDKFGKESVELHLIDNDFVDTFADQSYKSTKKWQEKMDRYYYDSTVWRGLSRQDEVIEEDEIVGMFTDVHYQFVSNRVMGVMDDSESAVRHAADDFNQYNDELVHGGLSRMAMDHSRAGELYNVSYGYSTSKKRIVGKAFAMGAMVIADYGKHQDYQHLLKSRVLVGLAQGKKDVDLMRLKQLRGDFSYKYFRQEEVMGIGAADPDSTRFVQLIDENGDAFKSYVRNPKNPKQIYVYESEVSDLKELAKKKPARIITLP